MNILGQIISGLNKEEVRFYKMYASRIKSAGPRKDLLLFDHLRSSADAPDEELFNSLYKGKVKNAYYRLKNRLAEDLNLCLLSQHYYKIDILYIYHLLSLSRLYFSRRNFQLAFKYIRKAEEEATLRENFELLDIIYGEHIRLSHEIVSINPEEYILKRQENSKLLNTHRQIDDILAAVNYRMKITQNFSEKETQIIKLLEKTSADFSTDPRILKSPKLRFKMYSAVSQVLLQRREYSSLEKYLLKTYTQFKKEKLFHKENHDLKLQMLTYIVNALFKNKKNEESLHYAEELNSAMQEFGKMLYEKYVFFYYNSLVINYSVQNKDKAIALLEELRENKALKQTPFYELFVYLNLAVLWFDKGEYHNSIRFLNKLYLHPNYKNADHTLKFKITVAELIIRYELQDFEFFEHRLKQVKKEYRNLLNSRDFDREKEMIGNLKKMIVSDNFKKDKKLVAQLTKFMDSGIERSEDAEIIDYNAWLRKKLTFNK